MTAGAPDIRREGVTARWADRVVWRDTVYLVEVPPDAAADADAQIAGLLASVADQLSAVGSSHARLLQVTVFLADFCHLERFNRHWEAWLPPGSAPARACLRADLADPRYVLEMIVVAATG